MGRRYTLAFDHHNMVPGPAASSAIQVIWKTEDGILVCYGTTAVASMTETNTYAPGCRYIDVNLAKSYINTETDPDNAPSWSNPGSDIDEDLNILSQVGVDGQFLVGTGAGTLAWESGATLLASLRLSDLYVPAYGALLISD